MWTLIVLAAIVLLFEILIFASGKTYLNRVFRLTIFSGKLGPDIDEMDLFKKREIAGGKPQPWPVSTMFNQKEISPDLMKQIEGFLTVSYVVIKDDSLIYEKNWENYGDDSYVNSFSMAKSLTSALIGCAIRDGLIKSIDEPVANYLPEFKEGEKSKITIRHLLTMSSGLDFKEEYVSPLAWPAEAYYGNDVNTLTLKANPVTAPGKIWAYKGGDTQLLGMILQKVLKKELSVYASERLWQPMGAEHPAYWSLDEVGTEKVSCCWYTNARDYARLAKLMMNKGNWNGTQLIDSVYAVESVMAAPLMDDEGGPNQKYGFQWWLMEHKGHKIFYARGIRGQYIFAVPDQNMIVVRLGHKRAPKAGHDVPADALLYLDAAMEVAGNNAN